MDSIKEQRMLKERERTPRMVLQELLERSDEIDDIAVSVSMENDVVETHLSTSDTIMLVGMLEISKKDIMTISEME